MGVDEANAIVQRLFQLASQRVGSAAALARSLGLSYSDVQTYVAGEAMPPDEVLLRTVDLVLDDLKTIRGTFSEQAWQSLGLPRAAWG